MAADEHPTAVLRCRMGLERVAGQGEWRLTLHQRAAVGIDAFVATLRRPNEPTPPQGSCLAYATSRSVQLEIGGQPVKISLPVDHCEHAQPDVIAAYGALTWADVSQVRGDQVRTEAAVQAGCHDWKDMIELSPEAKPGGPSPVLPGATSVKVCRYRVAEPGHGVPVGGDMITGAPVKQLLAALAKAGPATPCAAERTRFAVLAGEVYVELDGCHRILAPDTTLRQGDAALVALLGG